MEVGRNWKAGGEKKTDWGNNAARGWSRFWFIGLCKKHVRNGYWLGWRAWALCFMCKISNVGKMHKQYYPIVNEKMLKV